VVFVLDEQQRVARRKQVTVGPIVGDRVVVRSGLAAGERVITDGAAWLTDGRTVRLVEQPG
jgi:multidrug efflux pump subunit AcrA (membrane-fusion protein)